MACDDVFLFFNHGKKVHLIISLSILLTGNATPGMQTPKINFVKVFLPTSLCLTQSFGFLKISTINWPMSDHF